MPDGQIIHAACPHDCPDTCAMLVEVKDGRAERVSGDPSHPPTRGFLCTKVTRYLERVYNPDRLLYPMRRSGAKGEGRFERISWDDALDEIASRFSDIADSEDGPESILPYSYGGTMGLVNGASMDRRFFHRLGASLLARTICAAAGGDAMIYTLGAKMGTDVENFHLARFIVLWGTNTLSSNIHLWPEIKEAVANGAKLVGIDPYRNHTIDQCHQFIQLQPGTDAAFALAVMNVIVNEGLHDTDYIERHTLGFDLLRERIAEFPASRAASICGVSEEEIVNFAREYATTQPAVIRVNYGLQRHAGGGMAVRSIACLPALVGAWRAAGGGVLLSTSGFFEFDQRALERPDLMKGTPRTINMSRLGEALTEARPPVRAIYVYNSNPAAVAPDQSKVIEGFRREDLFTVVHEQFQTDTADYADILLPATTQLEHRDVVKPYGHYYVVYNEPAIAPLGEAKPNSEVFRLLAHRLGFDEECFKDSDEEIIRQALGSGHPTLDGITVERLKQEGWARLNLPETFAPFAEGGFRTPSGKCEFYSETMKQIGMDPLPAYIPPRESPATAPGLAARYPLQLISPPANSFLNTSFSHLPSFLKSEQQPFIEINAADAERRGISDGAMVRVWNDRGECTLVGRISNRVKPGVAVALSIWWNKLSPGRGNVNRTVSQEVTDLGGGATFFDNLVEVAVSNCKRR
ncbi:MAG TPA: molybdopterin oxidoreductase family protein [Blastocatellia bacterium]|jgi:anaerobic selenocysteine-containing dehydrogenase|nr:molybdopterin oxidoreductase family protein [Blastocatellia bacterium]